MVRHLRSGSVLYLPKLRQGLQQGLAQVPGMREQAQEKLPQERHIESQYDTGGRGMVQAQPEDAVLRYGRSSGGHTRRRHSENARIPLRSPERSGLRNHVADVLARPVHQSWENGIPGYSGSLRGRPELDRAPDSQQLQDDGPRLSGGSRRVRPRHEGQEQAPQGQEAQGPPRGR